MTDTYEVDVGLENVTVAYSGLEEDVSARPALRRRVGIALHQWRTTVTRKRFYIPVLSILLVTLILIICAITYITLNHRSRHTVIKSDFDNREYRAITLRNNSLRITLVSDRETPMAACGVAVPAGSFAEPSDVAGLAHFLEHMLFMGSEKYPNENEFETLVNTDGDGLTNAYTSDEMTDFYFATRLKFKLIMDVFAQFFVMPLLSESSIQREMVAVESEWKREMGIDGWKIYGLERYLSNPLHPFQKFSTGSITTLNRTDIQEKLWDFYDQYYSANLITVAIIGNETLDTLEQWAEEIFSAIPNKDKVKPVFNILPFPRGDKKYITRRVYYQPKSDKDSIKIIFPVNIRGYPDMSYVTYILGYEGKGSLFQYLSTRGYITSLLANVQVEAENFMLISIYCDLTEMGLKDPNVIVVGIFKLLKRLRDEGIDERLWQEIKEIDELKFRFKEKEDPSDYASEISARMARVTDPRDYLNPPSRRYLNISLEEEILSFLTPDNFNMYIGSLKLSQSEDTEYGPQLTKVEKWYTTPYRNIAILDSDIQNWWNVDIEAEIDLPEPNPFIPHDFTILPFEGSDLPVQLELSTEVDISDVTVWWYQDSEFNQPKISMQCYLQPAPKTYTIQEQLLSEMLSSIYLRKVADSLYSANSVDYTLNIDFTRFWNFELAGFSDPQKVMNVITEGLDSLFSLDFEQNEAHFNATIREPIRKYYLNVQNWNPAEQTLRNAQMLQEDYMFDYVLALDTLDTLSQSDVRKLRDSFLDNVDIDCSISGNVLQTQAASYTDILKNKLITDGFAKIVKEDRLANFIDPIYKFPKGKTLVVRHKVMNPDDPNSAVLTQFQIGLISSNGPYVDRLPFHRAVLVMLLENMLREPTFNYLRTQLQLGYVAMCFSKPFQNVLNFQIVVQGSREDAGAAVIANEHDKFVQMMYARFTNWSGTVEGNQMWADIKMALKNKLEEKPISLSEKTKVFDSEIFSVDRDFEKRGKQVAALEEITLTDFLEFYHRYLIGDERRKLSSQIYGKNDEIPATVDPEKDEVLVTNVEEYRTNYLTERFGPTD